jgi:hypothetical protein
MSTAGVLAGNLLLIREGNMTTQNKPQSGNRRSGEYSQPEVVKRYKYIHIWSSSDEIRVQCTHPQTIQVLIRAIQRTYPDSYLETREDLTSQVYIVKISELEPEDRHQKLAWWLFKMMCERGWEPMETGENWYKMKTT